ncbi:MAG TPA: type IV pilus modification protein PilV [Steroidobacteraceae bacterium]|nr:type IV pilus modification protein PilV [Steroidobacteraceae bacterium]
MVEVLVALVVVGVGMLGIASLYVTTLQAKTTAQARMKAINFAYDIADRIRANRTAGDSYAMTIGSTLTAPSSTTNCIESTDMAAITCTPAQMAANDLYSWNKLVTDPIQGLPGASGSIAVANANPTTYTITLQWSEPSSGTQSYKLTVEI